jgi:hypothetical protein
MVLYPRYAKLRWQRHEARGVIKFGFKQEPAGEKFKIEFEEKWNVMT